MSARGDLSLTKDIASYIQRVSAHFGAMGVRPLALLPSMMNRRVVGVLYHMRLANHGQHTPRPILASAVMPYTSILEPDMNSKVNCAP